MLLPLTLRRPLASWTPPSYGSEQAPQPAKVLCLLTVMRINIIHILIRTTKTPTMAGSVTVVCWLVWPIHGDIDVCSLLGRQLGELSTKLWQVKSSNLLVQVLGQDVDLLFIPPTCPLVPQFQLRNYLHFEMHIQTDHTVKCTRLLPYMLVHTYRAA